MIGLNVKVDVSRIASAQKSLQGELKDACKQTGEHLVAEVQKRVKVVTGATQKSVYLLTEDSDGYADAADAAQKANPDARLFPQVSFGDVAKLKKNEVAAMVLVGEQSAELLETGTTKDPAEPFFGPAFETAKDVHKDNVARAVNKAFSGR